jgi:hypothetical protein
VMRKLRMFVHNEGIHIQSIKCNSVSNAGVVLVGDTSLLTPQSQVQTHPVPIVPQAPPQTTMPTQPGSIR